MKNAILLFYPKAWQGEGRGRVPYALLYLERAIRDLDLEVILLDEQVEIDYMPFIDSIKDRLLFAGVSCMTGYQIQGAIKISEYLKENSSCKIIWGGWHPTLLPDQVLLEDFVDFVIMGQGEQTLHDLLYNLMNNIDIKGLHGIAYKNVCGEPVVNEKRGLIDCNQFEKVDLTLLDMNNYVAPSTYSKRRIGYFTSHGCPFKCAFCCIAEVFNRKWYKKQVEEIVEDLKYLKKYAHIDSVIFDDDNFFVDKEFTRKLCNTMIDEKLDLLWDTSAHAGLFLKIFTDDDLDLFYRSGCRQVYIGAESGDQEVLNLIAKQTTVEDNMNFIEFLNKHSIQPIFSTMVCFPMDPDNDIKKTIDMICRAKVRDSSIRARILFYTPYPSTELFDWSVKKGLVVPQTLEEWSKYTLRAFVAPWSKPQHRIMIERFANFYFPLSDPYYYKTVPPKYKNIARIVNIIFYPFAHFRLVHNNYKYPFESIIFLAALRLYNKVFKTNFSLGYESYLE